MSRYLKKKIIEMIRQDTKALTWETLDIFTASEISEHLGVSRNVVSQYLNELAKAGTLIKIKSRPVYFLHRLQLEEEWGVLLHEASFKNAADLRECLQSTCTLQAPSVTVPGFGNVIGSDGSLSYCVEQCKSAMAYPEGGLPLLLHGPPGTGKSMLARITYEYAINKGILANDAPFITFNCSEYANNPELVTANLFGHVKGAYTGAVRDNRGLLAAADGGVLFLDEVHCLRAECQEKLFLFMDQGVYHLMGDNDNWYTSDIRLVFATTENPEEVLLRTLLRRIPIVSRLPALDERSRTEKHELICFLLREEMERTNHCIYISNAVYTLMMQYSFKGNIGDLKNCIRASCANSFLKDGAGNGRLNITISNLPDYIMQNLSSGYIQDDEGSKLCSVEELTSGAQINRTLSFCHRLVTLHRDFAKMNTLSGNLLQQMLDAVTEYLDAIAYDGRTTLNPKQQLFTTTFAGIAEAITKKYALAPPGSMMASFSIHLYGLHCNRAAVKRLEDSLRTDIAELGRTLTDKLPKEHSIASEIMEPFQTQLSLEMGDLAVMLLTLVILAGNHSEGISRSMGVIVCHGRSTASSIASTVNTLLGNYIFDAVDIPMGAADEVLTRLKERLGVMQGFERLILLIDMGSPEGLCSGLAYLDHIDIGIVNNVSTRLALQVGEGLMGQQELGDLLKSASDLCAPACVVLSNRRRQDAVLTVCATGIGVARKIGELFFGSLPKKIPLDVIACDYETLRIDGIKMPVFSRNNVRFIIGTLNPHVEGVPFVLLDELRASGGTDTVARLLSPYLDQQETAQFQRNILKAFSLQNLLNYLTILNPDKVLGFLDKAVERLQEELGFRMEVSTVAGLYLHIGCLVEKLIMQGETLDFPDSDTFLDTNKDFVRCVKKSFSGLEHHYSVEIPLGEIKYIHDYVYMGHY